MAPVDAARAGAEAIRQAFERYRVEFRGITRRARSRFAQRDWAGGRQDASDRLELYRRILDELTEELRGLLAERCEDLPTWRLMKRRYAEALWETGHAELTQTFFNSATRRVLTTVGVDPEIEFVDLDPRRDRYGPGPAILRRYAVGDSLADVVRQVLLDREPAPFADLQRDADLTAEAIQSRWPQGVPLTSIELVESVFYRGTGAYIVGRLAGPDHSTPLVIALLNTEAGVEVDCVLMDVSEVSIVFSFTRSHFQVSVARPSELVRFLRTLMPRKPMAELYIALGHAKHGKTELYRNLLGRLGRSLDRFRYAPGETGMVMIVFTLRQYDYVFKVIRDRFAPPKTTTRDQVRSRYQLVFEHDRAGRLIEAQEFEHLEFEARRFEPELLRELAEGASQSVTVEGDKVAIHHLYIERKVEPLDLFLRRAHEDEAKRAVIDFGQAIRDLARTNIFPGDMLLKNFGVTRQGRVTFYDYDELCLVTDCRFRDLPEPEDDEEEWSAEPHFYVSENDVFPEEFLRFMGLGPVQREALLETHADILHADFWRTISRRQKDGEVLDVFPYPPSKSWTFTRRG